LMDLAANEPKQGISRRKLLKQIGAGAAVAWTAPVLTSIRTPAFAASPPGKACDPGQACSPQCTPPACMGNSKCGCQLTSPDNGAICQCLALVAFNPPPYCGVTPCPNGQPDCPSGMTCVQTCCGQACTSDCGAA